MFIKNPHITNNGIHTVALYFFNLNKHIDLKRFKTQKIYA
jgi:hypothetical protein